MLIPGRIWSNVSILSLNEKQKSEMIKISILILSKIKSNQSHRGNINSELLLSRAAAFRNY